MKAFVPATLLALAGATSACTFAYRSVANGNGDHLCAFEVYMEDDANVPGAGTGDGGTHVGSYYPEDCTKKDLCLTAESDNLGDKYEFCIKGSAGKNGKVDGDITVQRDGGTKVNLKPDGKTSIEDTQIAYWRGDIKCPGAKAPKPPKPTQTGV